MNNSNGSRCGQEVMTEATTVLTGTGDQTETTGDMVIDGGHTADHRGRQRGTGGTEVDPLEIHHLRVCQRMIGMQSQRTHTWRTGRGDTDVEGRTVMTYSPSTSGGNSRTLETGSGRWLEGS